MAGCPQVRSERPIVSRFTIVILAGVLIGTGVGNLMPTELAAICAGAGACGILAFVALEVAERRRHHEWTLLMKRSAERRLS